jgi:hypothetical protein
MLTLSKHDRLKQKFIPLNLLNMEYIDAKPDEATFVYDRMQTYRQATDASDRLDRSTNQMQNFLNYLNAQGTGCIP